MPCGHLPELDGCDGMLCVQGCVHVQQGVRKSGPDNLRTRYLLQRDSRGMHWLPRRLLVPRRTARVPAAALQQR